VSTGAKAGAGGQGRLEHIDGLRAVAALYVAMQHIFLYIPGVMLTGAVLRISRGFAYGHFSVDVFIVLSGFCLMLPVLRNHGELSGGAMNFFRKRARRILPPYYAVLALSLVLIWFFIGTPEGPMWKSSVPVTVGGLLAHLLLVQDWFSGINHQIDYVLWSISVEWRIYFLFPVLVYCWRRFGALQTVGVTAIVSILLMILVGYTPIDHSASGVSFQYYGLFAFGMLAAGLANSSEPVLARGRRALPWGVLVVVLMAVVLAGDKGYVHQIRLPWQMQDVLVGLATLCLLVAVAPGEGSDSCRWLRNVLGCKPLAFVGMFSYSLYLIHAPLLEVIWVYLIHPLHLAPARSLMLFFSVGMIAVVAVAYLFFLVFERPFIGPPRVRRPREKRTQEPAEALAQ
jgi:peptidoglycan/LPS O-acetylase OafA/YrhL